MVVEFWLALANAAIVGGRLLRRAWACYRWRVALPTAHDHLLALPVSRTTTRQAAQLSLPTGHARVG